MRGVVRAAAYLPSYTDGAVRRCGADEDEFTLAATVLERALPRLPERSPLTVRLLGFRSPPSGAALSAVAGRPVTVEGAGEQVGSLAAALASLAASDRAECLIVARRLSRGEPPIDPADRGEGSAALVVDDGGDAIPLSTFRPTAPVRADPLTQLWAWLGGPGGLGSVGVGDWVAPVPARGQGAVPDLPDGPPYTVAEGAFVPAPRYQESLRSRWRFLADRCQACGERTFPSRGRCGRCGRTDALHDEPLPLDGAKVVASTWIGQGGQPTEFDPQVEATGPYGVVLAELEPGVRVTLPVADAEREQVSVGARVDTRLRRLYAIEGAWRYGRKAVPAPRRGEPPAPDGT